MGNPHGQLQIVTSMRVALIVELMHVVPMPWAFNRCFWKFVLCSDMV